MSSRSLYSTKQLKVRVRQETRARPPTPRTAGRMSDNAYIVDVFRELTTWTTVSEQKAGRTSVQLCEYWQGDHRWIEAACLRDTRIGTYKRRDGNCKARNVPEQWQRNGIARVRSTA